MPRADCACEEELKASVMHKLAAVVHVNVFLLGTWSRKLPHVTDEFWIYVWLMEWQKNGPNEPRRDRDEGSEYNSHVTQVWATSR